MQNDDRIRSLIREGQHRVSAPPPDLEQVLRGARLRRMRRNLVGVLVAGLVAVSILLPLGLLSVIGKDRSSPVQTPGGGKSPSPSAPNRIAAYGIQVDLPESWDGRLSYTTSDFGPFLRAGSFPLPESDIGFHMAASQAMGSDDVVIVLQEFVGICPCVGLEPVDLPLAIAPDDFFSWPGLRQDHAYAERLVVVDDRHFSLWAEFGTTPAPDPALAQVNEILSTLLIDTDAPEPVPSEIPGEAYPAPAFQSASGWNVASTGTVTDLTFETPLAWASSVPFPADDLAIAVREGTLTSVPDHTLQALPSDAILIVASWWLPESPDPQFEVRQFPLRLSDAEVLVDVEGIPQNIATYRIRSRINDRYVEVEVYFGTVNPDAEVLALAQEELERLQLPEA